MKRRLINYKRKRMSYARYIWIINYGFPPSGYVIHHLNGNPKDDRLINLTCISKENHAKLHSKKWDKVNGRWYKQCKRCSLWKREDDYYKKVNLSSNQIRAECRDCSKLLRKQQYRERKKYVRQRETKGRTKTCHVITKRSQREVRYYKTNPGT